jgi:hypothetical protein
MYLRNVILKLPNEVFSRWFSSKRFATQVLERFIGFGLMNVFWMSHEKGID